MQLTYKIKSGHEEFSWPLYWGAELRWVAKYLLENMYPIASSPLKVGRAIWIVKAHVRAHRRDWCRVTAQIGNFIAGLDIGRAIGILKAYI